MSFQKTGIIYDFQMNYHSNEGIVHPENPSRLHSLISHIESTFSHDKNIEIITSASECDEKMITLVHSEDYLLRIKKLKFISFFILLTLQLFTIFCSFTF